MMTKTGPIWKIAKYYIKWHASQFVLLPKSLLPKRFAEKMVGIKQENRKIIKELRAQHKNSTDQLVHTGKLLSSNTKVQSWSSTSELLTLKNNLEEIDEECLFLRQQVQHMMPYLEQFCNWRAASERLSSELRAIRAELDKALGERGAIDAKRRAVEIDLEDLQNCFINSHSEREKAEQLLNIIHIAIRKINYTEICNAHKR